MPSILHAQVPFKVSMGPSYNPPTRYLFWAFVVGDISFEEAHNILVTKYKFGPEGAREALERARKYPALTKKPTNYEEKIYGEQSL